MAKPRQDRNNVRYQAIRYQVSELGLQHRISSSAWSRASRRWLNFTLWSCGLHNSCLQYPRFVMKSCGCRYQRPIIGAATQNLVQCMKQGIAKVVELYSLILWTSYSYLQCPRFVMNSCRCRYQRPIIGAATQNLVQWMKQSVAKVVVLYTLILWTSYSSFSALYRIARVHL